jgi:serine/threonine protein kinase
VNIKMINIYGFSNVYLYKRKQDDLLICLKFINLRRIREQSYKKLKSEINIVKQLNHSNIVQYI